MTGLAHAASIVLVRVKAGGLDVRAQPSAESEVIGSLAAGAEVVATIGAVDGWLLVRSSEGRPGYVAGRYVDLLRVIAVDGDPVPSRAGGAGGGGACGAAASIDVAIADIGLACEDRVLGRGVAACVVTFAVEAATRCDTQLYRTLECEAQITFERLASVAKEAARASAATVLILDGGAGVTELAVDWKPPSAGAPVSGVRLESGTCTVR